MNNAEVLIKFKGDTTDADSKTKAMTTSMGSLTKSFTLANVAAQAITKTMSIFSSNLDSAISRVDTLNNFPKVMSNLGISAEESDEVIKDLSDRLQGLPTSLDAAAMAVQRFTSKNGDVKESEKVFLAVNNAILAGGANANIQSQALEQISQAYAKGKPDMMEWRALMTAMPAQLKQVATAMGYTDAAMLGEAVRAKEGEAEFARMIDTMVRMNTEGVAGFKSFDEQARNATGGIGTSVTNMKTAITRGIADMIQSIDGALKPFGGLSGVISSIGKTGEKIFKKLGNIIAEIIPKIQKMVKFFKEHKALMIALVSIIGGVIAILKVYQAIMLVINTITAIQNALLLANPVVLIISAIIVAITAVIAIVTYLWNHCEGFRNAVKAIIEAIKNMIKAKLDFIKMIFNAIVDVIKFVINWVKENWKYMIGFLVNPFGTAFKMLYDKCEGFRNFIDGIIDKVKNAFQSAGDKIKSIFTTVRDFVKGAFDKIKDAGSTAFTAIKDTVVNAFSGIGEIIKAPINAIIGAINKVLQGINKIKIPDWVPGIGGQHTNFSTIPTLAVGTNYVPDDTLAYIHQGEAVVPKKFNPYANGINANTIGLLSGGNNPTINVYANFETDPLGQVVSKIKTFSGGAKNDYNWGSGI